MKTIAMQDKPAAFPTTQVNGTALKPITQVLLDRRATPHFKPDPVPDEHVQAILQFATQAPSGFNAQPWRFIVVRDAGNRRRLQQAAMNQAKVGEAPVVVIAFAIKDEWRDYLEDVLEEGARRGAGKPDAVQETMKMAAGLLDQIPSALWLNRHTMIAFTAMMLVAEAYGLNTAPMEGFDPEAVKREFGLPDEAEVVALLALGFAEEPFKPYPGRLALDRMVYAEHYRQEE